MSHPDDAHGLRVQLTAALLDCHALRARITAAESERDALRALLRGCRPLVAKAHVEADEGTEEGWFDFLRRIDAFLAAPAAGEEGT